MAEKKSSTRLTVHLDMKLIEDIKLFSLMKGRSASETVKRGMKKYLDKYFDRSKLAE